jgi:hypothetical protein
MMSDDRRTKSNKVIQKILTLPDVASAFTDDYDSTAINVFINLKLYFNNVGVIKRRITAALRKEGVSFNFLDWPQKVRQSYTIRGYRYSNAMGYDKECVKIEVFI